MTAAGKFGARFQRCAFMAGYHVAVRNERMIESRQVRSLKGNADHIKQLVASARESNRKIVSYLRAARVMSFADYDRERRISATGAFGRVPYNPPAGSLE